MKKSTRRVTGAYSGIVAALVVMLVAILVYLFYSNFVNNKKDVSYEARLVNVESISASDGMLRCTYNSVEVQVKISKSMFSFGITRLKVVEGDVISVYYSSDGYTLYEPNTGEYSVKIYGDVAVE